MLVDVSWDMLKEKVGVSTGTEEKDTPYKFHDFFVWRGTLGPYVNDIQAVCIQQYPLVGPVTSPSKNCGCDGHELSCIDACDERGNL